MWSIESKTYGSSKSDCSMRALVLCTDLLAMLCCSTAIDLVDRAQLGLEHADAKADLDWLITMT
jgi:hypothetical protein